jgi:hypothetical protein
MVICNSVNRSELNLRELLGVRVSFKIEKTADGLQARNVRITYTE